MKPLSILVEYDNEGVECYSHPYAFEIDNFRLPEQQMLRRDPALPKISALALPETPCVMVSNVEGLNSMIRELSGFTEIGVDLEAHNYRTYLGLTCLIQVLVILTKRKNFFFCSVNKPNPSLNRELNG